MRHIHVIVLMGGVDGISRKWGDIKTLPRKLMRFRWKKFLLKMFDWLIVVSVIMFIGFALVLDGFVGGAMKWILVIGFIGYFSKCL